MPTKTRSRIEVPKMYKLFIGSKFTRTESERYIAIKSGDGRVICNISRASKKDLRNAVQSARAGLHSWSSKTAYERAQILYRMAEMLEGRKEQFAAEIKLSTGASKRVAMREVTKSIDRIIFYAGFADKWMQLSGSVNPVQSGYFNFSIPEPTGVVGIILPDLPSFIPLVSRICAVITSGNSCVIIASERYPLSSLSFAEVIQTGDIPSGVVNILTGYRSELVPHLASHMDVNAVDMAIENFQLRKSVQECCSVNVKRFVYSALPDTKDWFDDSLCEDLRHISNFTEIKTVWHTMGF